MPTTVCPFCFRKIDSSHLAYQCAGRGNIECKKKRTRTGRADRQHGGDLSHLPATHARPERVHQLPDLRRPGETASLPQLSHRAADRLRRLQEPDDRPGRRQGQRQDGADDRPGQAAARGGRAAVRRRHQDRHRQPGRAAGPQRIPGQPGRPAVQQPDPARSDTGQAEREGAGHPVVLRWRQESARLVGGQALQSTVLSFVDTAGEDLNDLDTAFTLEYLSVCDALIITLDPFALPGARSRLNLPKAAIQVDDDVPLDVVSRITELLRTEGNINNRKRIKLPVAIVFTKIDAFYPTLDRQNPIMSTAAARCRRTRTRTACPCTSTCWPCCTSGTPPTSTCTCG